VKLLAIPGSHPCAAVAAMLEAKGIRYQRLALFPAVSRIWLRLVGFKAGTVPAAYIDGVRVQGSRAIARALDAYRPNPLFSRATRRHGLASSGSRNGRTAPCRMSRGGSPFGR
jgi:glutathione S-transferase